MSKHQIQSIFCPLLANRIAEANKKGANLSIVRTKDFPPGEPTENRKGQRAYFAVVADDVALERALVKAGV